jgi:hypothetical protein
LRCRRPRRPPSAFRRRRDPTGSASRPGAT